MLSLVEKVYNDYKIVVNGVIIFIGLFLCFLGLKSVVVRFRHVDLRYSLICSSVDS